MSTLDTDDFFEDAELKLEELCERVNRVQKNMKHQEPHQNEVLESQMHETHHWLKSQEQKLERLIDRGELKLHLAKMDTENQLAGIIEKMDRARTAVNAAKIHTEIKLGNTLKSISDSCLSLRRGLIGEH